MKPVAVDIASTVVDAVVCTNEILLEPNATERVLLLLELNIPNVWSNPPKFRVPAVKKQVDVAVYVCVPSSVSVTPSPLTPMPPSCLLNCAVHVCVRVNIGMRLV